MYEEKDLPCGGCANNDCSTCGVDYVKKREVEPEDAYSSCRDHCGNIIV